MNSYKRGLVFRLRRSPGTMGRELVSDTAWSGVASLVPQIISVATVPIILHEIGVAGYGVWALTNTLVIFAVSLDGGISTSAQRFYVVNLLSGRDAKGARFTATLVGLIVLASGAIYVAGPMIAYAVLSLAHIPPSLRPDAEFMSRNIGVLVCLILLGNLLYGYMRAIGRFRDVAICSSVSYLVFLCELVIARNDLTLRLTFLFAVLQFAALDLCLLYCARHHLWRVRLRFLSKRELAEFCSYAWRAQIMNLSSLVVLETDALFVASILPIGALGYLAIGAQVASAVRSIPMFALPPLLTRLTQVFSHGGDRAAVDYASRANAVWVDGLVLYSATAICAVAFGVRAWAGHFPSAELVAVILTFGNCVNLLTGVSSLLCRAIGRPGLEAKYGIVLLLSNLIVSWPCTYFWGLAGAVGSTAAVQALGFVYFQHALAKVLPALRRGGDQIRVIPLMMVLVLSVALELPSLLLTAASIATFAVAAGGAAIVLTLVAVHVRRTTLRLLAPTRAV